MASESNSVVRMRPGVSTNEEGLLPLLLDQMNIGKARLQKDAKGKLRIVYEDDNIAYLDVSSAHTIQKAKNETDAGKKANACLEMIEACKEKRAGIGVALKPEKVAKMTKDSDVGYNLHAACLRLANAAIVQGTKQILVSLAGCTSDKFSGVFGDHITSKWLTCPSAQGDYKEGKDFCKLQEILGCGSLAGQVVVVQDIKTGCKHAMKTVMLSHFRTDEVRCWIDLDDSASFPNLYLFRLEGGRIVFHMEIIENSVSMEDLIKEHIWCLREQEPDLLRPFSFYLFHDLLQAVKEMHDKNWTHNDLHSLNVMLTKDAMSVKVLDFGMAKPLRTELTFNTESLKNDILCAINLFCTLYLGDDCEQKVKCRSVKEIMEKAKHLSTEDRQEVLELVTLAFEVATCEKQEGYGNLTCVMEKIKSCCNLEKDKKKVMKMAAAVLFPEEWAGQADDISLHAQQASVMIGDEVADSSGDLVTDGLDHAQEERHALMALPFGMDIDIEVVASKLSDDVLEKLCLKPLDVPFC